MKSRLRFFAATPVVPEESLNPTYMQSYRKVDQSRQDQHSYQGYFSLLQGNRLGIVEY